MSSDNPFLAGLSLTNRFTCPATVEAYTLAKLSGPTTLAVVGTGDADADVAGVFLGARRQGENQGIPVCTSRGVLVPLLSDGADPLAVDDRVTVSPVTAGRVGLAVSGGIGRVVVGCPAVADSVALVLFEGASGGAGATVDLQEAYDNGNQIDCAAAQPVVITADPTNFDAIEIKDGSTTVGTVSGFAGAGGLALYGAKDEGARIAVRTQTGAGTGADAVVSAGRGGPTAGLGGNSTLIGGQGGTTNGSGGEARVTGGLGTGTGIGGDAVITAGAAGATGSDGGSVRITGGSAAGGRGGDVVIGAGAGVEAGAGDGDINIGTSNTDNVYIAPDDSIDLQSASIVASYPGHANKAINISLAETALRGANANNNCISMSANGVGGAPKIAFLGAAAVVRQATPTTLSDVIAILQAFGFCS